MEHRKAPMDTQKSIRFLKAENLTTLIVCFCLTLFIGIMSASLVFLRADTQKQQIKDLKEAQATKASAMSGFFAERVTDLHAISAAPEFFSILGNLTMSMEPCPDQNFEPLKKSLLALTESKVIGHNPIYSRLIFISPHGDILVDTQETPGPMPSFWPRMVTAGEKNWQILTDGPWIAVCLPVYFKTTYAGRLAGFVNIGPPVIQEENNEIKFALMTGDGKLNLPAGIFLNGMNNGLADPAWFPDNEARIIKGVWNDKPCDRIIISRIQVPQTPFFIVGLTRASGISREMMIGILLALIPLLGAGIFFIWRNSTLKLIMQIRLSEARAGEEHLKQIVEFLPIPIAEYDFDLNIRYANQAGLKTFGFSQADIDNGLSILQLLEAEERHRIYKWTQAVKNGKKQVPLIVTTRRKDGRLMWGRVISQRIFKNGSCIGMRLCFIDMTEQFKAEQASLRAVEMEKYVLVGQVAGKMAHDFNNVLGAIMGNAELSLLECQDPDTQNTLEIILEQVKRGRILTQNLVAFAKDQEITEKYFNINEKMDLVLNLLKKELRGVEIFRHYETDLPELLADPGMIEHALVNLIQNAVHAMAQTKSPELHLFTRNQGDSLRIAIHDNGCGVPAVYKDKIFLPAFTLKGSRDVTRAYPEDLKGTGYGLSNVKKYIDKHKGTLRFTSQEGKGTQFTITLPLTARDLLPEEKEKLVEKKLVKKKHILIVEDEEAIALVLEKIMTSHPFHHTVDIARDADTAFSLLSEKHFDLISLDYVLPGRRNGLDIYEHIRKRWTTLPIIFISGNFRFLESMEALKSKDPCVDHLSKPFKNLEYADKVNDWLHVSMTSKDADKNDG